jgi:type I restriction enzyme S subunit
MAIMKQLSDICSVHTGSQLNRDKMLDVGQFPVINGGKIASGYSNSYNEQGQTITISQGGESAGFVNWIGTNFWAGAHCYVVRPMESVDNRFLYHSLKNSEYSLQASKQGAGIPGLNRKTLLKHLIFVPSLIEQKRIVSILDTFIDAIDNIQKQIEQRKKQFEFFRNKLLDVNGEGTEIIALEKLFTFKNGLNIGKDYFGTGKPIIMFTNVFNSRFIDSSMVINKVNISDKELERINAHIGDVFFTRTSETKADVGYSSVLIEEINECTYAGFLIRARPITEKLLPVYCKYCFSTPKVREAIVSKSSFTTRASLTGNGLGKVTIPVPSIGEQKHIADILDNIEATIINLEAQLAYRQKQYEYYRNKLLTFE